MISAMEDTGTLKAITFLSAAPRVDLNRVLVLCTVSNYDREARARQGLKVLRDGEDALAAYMPALEAAERTGDRVVRYLVAHWAECETDIPKPVP